MVGSVFSLIFGLVPLALIAVVVAAVVLGRRMHEEGVEDPGIGVVRRFFLYGVALIALAFMASGVALLVAATIDALREAAVAGARDSRFPLGLAFLIVGGPVWGGAWLIATRVVERHPVERRALLRWLYLALVRGIALVVMVVAAIDALIQVFGASDISGGSWGWLIAWAIAWAFHQRMVAVDPPPSEVVRSIDRLYRAFGSVIGLGLLATSVGFLAAGLLDYLYDTLFLPRIVGDAGDLWHSAREPLAAALVGATVWSWHWLRGLRPDAGSTLWLIYVFLAGILSGTATTVVAMAIILYQTLEWFIGVPWQASAAAHFEFLPGALGALLAGAALWGYHRTVQREAHPPVATEASAAPAEPVRTEPERIYRYLVAAAGLVTFAIGLVILLAMAIEVVVEPGDVVRGDDWWRNRLVAAVTFMVIGGPLWARYWFDAQRHASMPGERQAQPRRVFIFGIFGLATLVALGSLVHVLYTFLDAAFERELGATALRDTSVTIALVLTAGLVSVYYWLVLREDQRAQSAVAPGEEPTPEALQVVRPREVLLFAPGEASALAAALRARLDARVRVERRLDTDEVTDGAAALTDEQVAGLAAAIGGSGAERVLVVLASDGSAQVVPYR